MVKCPSSRCWTRALGDMTGSQPSEPESVDVRAPPKSEMVMIMLTFSLYITQNQMPDREKVTQEINKMNLLEVLQEMHSGKDTDLKENVVVIK